MDDTTKVLIESLNKNIEIIRREILCKIDDSNLRFSENLNKIDKRLEGIEKDLSTNFVKKEDCEKNQSNAVTKEKYKLERTHVIVGAIAGAGSSLITLIGTLFANGTIHVP